MSSLQNMEIIIVFACEFTIASYEKRRLHVCQRKKQIISFHVFIKRDPRTTTHDPDTMAKKLKKREILGPIYPASVSQKEIDRVVKAVMAIEMEIPKDRKALYATAPHLKRKH